MLQNLSDQSSSVNHRWRRCRAYWSVSAALLSALVLVDAPVALAVEPTMSSVRRSLELADLERLRSVADVAMSPRGDWVAYSVSAADPTNDGSQDDLWLSRWRGGESIQLTSGSDDEHSPQWSPDGARLAFLSERGRERETSQLWILDMTGGEAERVTDLEGSIVDYAFAPNGRQLALIVEDPKPNESRKDATPPPIVIDRFYFKEDGAGYLTQRRRHLYLYDLATRRAELLTPGNFDEVLPSWSPDGKQIAFASKRRDDPDRNDTFGIFIIEPRVGAVPRLLVEYQGAGGDTEWATRPQWSPNGQQIAFVAGGDPKLIYYATYGIAVVGSAGGTPRYLTKSLDRNAWAPQWSADGREIYFLLEESETQQLARVALDAGRITRITDAAHTVGEVSVSGGRIAILRSTSERPDEVFAVERKALRQLSRQNDAWLQDIELAPVEPIRARSADGTQVHGFMLRAKNQKAEPAPTILRIHGGPVAQYTHSFMFEWQLLAAEGFAVVAGNPRGSSGRGEAFASAIYADWGRKDTQDVLALVDAAVARGVADPVRLGVGGWSYGGILTNYVIAQDTRFKAAISGASISNAIAGYGTDMYVREYEIELGVPWKNLNAWLQISSPFLHADRIVTPTLFICGDQDFNVPLLNSEQMYQALRSRNVPTQLVIYPGQTHAITKLSYRRDRLQRYLDWYSRYLTK